MSANTIHNEQQLLLRIAEGDESGFAEIYNKYFFTVLHRAQQLVEDRQAAEDVTTEVFVKLWAKRQEIPAVKNLYAFLLTAVKNACLNQLRTNHRNTNRLEELAARWDLNEDVHSDLFAVKEAVLLFLEQEIEGLPIRMKTILRLQLEGNSNNEIALKLGVSEKTVRNIKTESLKLLRSAAVKKEFFALLLTYLTKITH